jgi:hypothetical protein
MQVVIKKIVFSFKILTPQNQTIKYKIRDTNEGINQKLVQKE